MTTTDPKAYILAHDKRVCQLDRQSVASLRAVYSQALRQAGLIQVCGGPVSKDELINAIVEAEFPDITSAREAHVQAALTAAEAGR